MIKRLLLFFVVGVILVLAGTLLYFHQYQSLPEFAISLVSEAKIPGPKDKVIVFAPHPDDEILATGGLIYQAIKNGAEVYVVIVTCGDGYRFSSMEEFKKFYPTVDDYVNYGYARQEESKMALEILGVKQENILFLGYPDLGLKHLLDENWKIPYDSPYSKESASPYANSYTANVSYTGENLQNDIVSILEKYQPTMVAATSEFDIHPDHAATSEFVKKAVEKMAGPKPVLDYFLVHFRHFPNPKGLHRDRMLLPPLKLLGLGHKVFKVTLDQKTIDLKEKALAQYQSQLKVPFAKREFYCFLRQNELLFSNP